MATTNNIPRGMGQGTPAQEIRRWVEDAGKRGRIQVIDEGLQEQLFSPDPVRMVRLYSKNGDSLQLTAETAAAYGFRPTQPHRAPAEHAPTLFDTQTTLF